MTKITRWIVVFDEIYKSFTHNNDRNGNFYCYTYVTDYPAKYELYKKDSRNKICSIFYSNFNSMVYRHE